MPTRCHDFEARLRFLSPEEGGRRTPVRQGYRADFRYVDDPMGTAWMIHPHEFVADDGQLLPEDVSVSGSANARMYILSERYRASEHRSRLHVGTKFQVVEGNQVVAEGVVTKIVGLHDD